MPATLRFITNRKNPNYYHSRRILSFLLLSPLVIGILGSISLNLKRPQPFAFQHGDPFAAITGLFILANSAFLTGIISMFLGFSIQYAETGTKLNQKTTTNQKFFIEFSTAALIAVYQSFILFVLFNLVLQLPVEASESGSIIFTLTLCILTALGLGQLLFTFVKSIYLKLGFVIVLFLINILLCNILIDIPQPISNLSPTFLAFKNLITISGIGSDISSDPCWDFPDEIRSRMTLEDKAYFGCHCMGISIFNQSSCNFPGSGRYAVAELYLPEPNPPQSLGLPPEKPALPKPPPIPEDPNDLTAKQQYQTANNKYLDQIQKLESEYQLYVLSYNFRLETYKSQYETYLSEFEIWSGNRAKAVQLAENNILALVRSFRWGFFYKNSKETYRTALIKNWLYQTTILSLIWIILKIKNTNMALSGALA